MISWVRFMIGHRELLAHLQKIQSRQGAMATDESIVGLTGLIACAAD